MLAFLLFALLLPTAAMGAPCTLSTVSPSVTICTPVNGATVTSPVTVTAGTTDNAHPVTAMILYLDNKAVYKVSTNQLSTSLTLSGGSHNITVNAWDSTGAVFKSTSIITVSGTGSGPVSVAVNPASATLSPGASQQFTATVLNTSNTAVTWSVDGTVGGSSATGTISNTGLYTAPQTSGTHTVLATSVADTTKSDSAIVTVSAGGGSCSPTGNAPSVTICSPASGTSVGSPVQITAVGTSTTPITKTLVYVDSVLQYQTTAASVNTQVAIASGTHQLTVQFYDGAWIKKSETFTVASSGGGGGSTGSANVLTWHYDNERTGLNPNETNLTLSNVKAGSFGKLFSYLVDGYLYAQPLYVSGLTVGGAKHNVVFVATERASVYAFDADSYGTGAPLWQRSLLESGESPATGTVQPFQGITSTPVIDASSGTMYVVSAQKTSSSSFFRLHALDITTGAEKFGGPVVISASVPGTNSDAVNGVVHLTTSCVQRAALLLAENTVFAGFSGCHSGWLVSYDAGSLAQTGVFNSSPDTNGYGTYGGAGGIWMGGGGPAADSNGSIYITTGNGPYNDSTAWADSVLKFNAQLKLLDHFTPHDWSFLQCRDADLSAGGLLLIPGASRALVGGKTGKLYLVNIDALGGEQANDAGAVQTLFFEQDISAAYTTSCTTNTGSVQTSQVTGYQIYGTAAFFNGAAYLGVTPSNNSVRGPVRRFPFNGQLSYGSVTPDSIAPGSYGTTPFISANGTANGIVWIIDHGNPLQNANAAADTAAVLRAYNAADMTQEIYNSKQNAADSAGLGIKFTSPIVANGKVFIGTGHDPLTTANPRGELDVYGLK